MYKLPPRAFPPRTWSIAESIYHEAPGGQHRGFGLGTPYPIAGCIVGLSKAES